MTSDPTIFLKESLFICNPILRKLTLYLTEVREKVTLQSMNDRKCNFVIHACIKKIIPVLRES